MFFGARMHVVEDLSAEVPYDMMIRRIGLSPEAHGLVQALFPRGVVIAPI
jgi:hypothetical protein